MGDRHCTCDQLFEKKTSSFTYLLADIASSAALIIDPVLDAAPRDLQHLGELGLELRYILETHLHADHISGAAALRAATGARVGVSRASGIQGADELLEDGARITLESCELVCIATPGHTRGCLSYYVDGMVFTGDCLLIGGTGRTDLPGGDPGLLFDSIRERLWALPADTRVYPAHEYLGGRYSTIGYEKRFNLRVGEGVEKEEFIRLMSAREQRPPPANMSRAIPANLLCGLALDADESSIPTRVINGASAGDQT